MVLIGTVQQRFAESRRNGQFNEACVAQNKICGRPAWLGKTAMRLLLLAMVAALSVSGLTGCGSSVTLNSSNSLVLKVTPNPLAFGNVTVGQTSSATITMTNETLAPVTVSQIAITGQAFTITSSYTLPITIASGATYSLTAQFAPTTAGTATGQITVTNDSATSSSVVVDLTGTGSATIPPASGLTCASSSLTGSTTDTCTVTLSAAAPSGGATVSLSSNNTAVTVPSTVTVLANATSATFTATAAAVSSTQTATLTATAGGTSQTVALQLNGVAALLTADASSIAFGNVIVNQSSTQTLTLTSAGTSAVTVNSVALTGANFAISGSSFPATLSPGQTATVNVTYTPTAVGASTGSLAITSTSSIGATTTIPLSGTGETVSVLLSWNAPTSSTDAVVSYNVYRAASGSSSYSRINSSTETATTYTDATIASSTTYEYYVTSVDAQGNESTPSNTASATIP